MTTSMSISAAMHSGVALSHFVWRQVGQHPGVLRQLQQADGNQVCQGSAQIDRAVEESPRVLLADSTHSWFLAGTLTLFCTEMSFVVLL